VQHYLDELAQGSSSEPVIRALLDRAAGRLWQLCSALLHRGYPRLTRPPLNLQADEMLSAVVERLMKALRETRPANVRQFFALASQHMRWELNDMARRLDQQPGVVGLPDELAGTSVSSESGLSPDARRILRPLINCPMRSERCLSWCIQGLSRPKREC
jgi:RNA polymerase sigma-70 factor (ECF subfamily)